MIRAGMIKGSGLLMATYFQSLSYKCFAVCEGFTAKA